MLYYCQSYSILLLETSKLSSRLQALKICSETLSKLSFLSDLFQLTLITNQFQQQTSEQNENVDVTHKSSHLCNSVERKRYYTLIYYTLHLFPLKSVLKLFGKSSGKYFCSSVISVNHLLLLCLILYHLLYFENLPSENV